MMNKHLRLAFINGFVMMFFALASISVSHAKDDSNKGFSDNKGFYVGAGVGQADQRDTCDDAIGSCDDDDLGWKVFAGYKFNKYLAIEGGSVDFGQADGDTFFLNVDTLEIVPGTLEIKVDGFFLSGMAEWPINNKFSVLVKLGMIYWDIEFDATDVADNLELIGDEDENGTDVFYGLGAQYKITDNLALRAEWERFNNIGDSEIGATDIDLISGGIVLQF